MHVELTTTKRLSIFLVRFVLNEQWQTMAKMAITKFAMANDGNTIKWMAKMADSESDNDSDSV